MTVELSLLSIVDEGQETRDEKLLKVGEEVALSGTATWMP
jgi:hypothetical protein